MKEAVVKTLIRNGWLKILGLGMIVECDGQKAVVKAVSNFLEMICTLYAQSKFRPLLLDILRLGYGFYLLLISSLEAGSYIVSILLNYLIPKI